MRQGGSYRVEKEGDDPKLLERTEDHKDGNRARDKKGKPLDTVAMPADKTAAAPKASKTKVKEKDNASTA